MQEREIKFGGLSFNGGLARRTPYTLAWVKMSGGVKRDRTPRENSHGAFPSQGFADVMRISWGGLILTRNPVDQENAMRALRSLAGISEPSTWLSEGVFTRSAQAERASIPDPQIEVYGEIASYQVEVEVPSGFLYGQTRTFGPATSVQAYHYGNADAVPSITVTGSMPSGYRVNGPGGRQFIVSQALTSGVTHRLDFESGWLYRNEVLQQGAVSRAEVWTIPPGLPGTSMSLAPVSGSGQMTVKVTDTDS